MSHRSIATIHRPPPHFYRNNPDAPGTCQRCHLIRGNDVHDPKAAAEAEKAERRAELEAGLASSFIDPSAAAEIRKELDGDDP